MELVNDALNDAMMRAFILSVLAFVLAMMLTPVYTFLAYRYKFWKKQRTASTTGEALKVFTKLHANKFKRNIPTMAGAVFVVAIAVVTLLFNLDRQETWLPLAALAGGAIVGLIDDIINIRGPSASTWPLPTARRRMTPAWRWAPCWPGSSRRRPRRSAWSSCRASALPRRAG